MKQIILLAILIAHASHASNVDTWLEHENVREGVKAAYELCQGKSPDQMVTFSFKDGEVPSLLTVTCEEIIDHIDSKEPTTA